MSRVKKSFKALKQLAVPAAGITAATLSPEEAEATRIFANRAQAMRLLENMTKGTGKLEPEKLMSEINAMELSPFDTKRALSDLLGSAVIETSPIEMSRADLITRRAYPHLDLKNTPINISNEIPLPSGNILDLNETRALGAYIPIKADPLASPIYINPKLRDPESLVSTLFHESQHSLDDFRRPLDQKDVSLEAFTKASENAAKKELANKTKDLSIFAKTDEDLKKIDSIYGISKYTTRHHAEYPKNFELEKLTERINKGEVVPSKAELDEMFFRKYGKRVAAGAPLSQANNLETSDIDPISLAQDLYKNYNEKIAQPLKENIKEKLLPNLKIGNKDYQTTSPVSEALVDLGMDPLNVIGPVGEVLQAGQMVEMLPERKKSRFSIFDKINK